MTDPAPVPETLLLRMRQWLEPRPDDESRCAICAWPLMTDEGPDTGCVRGNCSMRPLPDRFYAPERAKRECPHVTEPARHPVTFSLSVDDVRALLSQQSEISRLSALLQTSKAENELLKSERVGEFLSEQAKDHPRLFDMVRYCRGQLLNEGLITALEYADLVSGRDSSQAARRLETYDALKARVGAADASLASLRANIDTLLARWDELYPAPKPGDIFQNRAVQEQYIHDALEPLRALLPSAPERS